MKKLFLRIVAAALVPVLIGADPAWAAIVNRASPLQYRGETSGRFDSQALQSLLSVGYRQGRAAIDFCQNTTKQTRATTLYTVALPFLPLAGYYAFVSFGDIMSSGLLYRIGWPVLSSLMASLLIVKRANRRSKGLDILFLSLVAAISGWALWPYEAEPLRFLGVGSALIPPLGLSLMSRLRPKLFRKKRISNLFLWIPFLGMLVLGGLQISPKVAVSFESSPAKPPVAERTAGGIKFYQERISIVPFEGGQVVEVRPQREFTNDDIVVAWHGVSDQTLSALPAANRTLVAMGLPPITLVSAEPNYGPQDHPLYVFKPTDSTPTDAGMREGLNRIVALREPFDTARGRFSRNQKVFNTQTNPNEAPEITALITQAKVLTLEVNIQDRLRNLYAASVTATGNFSVVLPLLAGETQFSGGVPLPIFDEQLPDLITASGDLTPEQTWTAHTLWGNLQTDLRFGFPNESEPRFSISMRDIADMTSDVNQPLEDTRTNDAVIGGNPKRRVTWLAAVGRNLPTSQVADKPGLQYAGAYKNGVLEKVTQRGDDEFYVIVEMEGAKIQQAHPTLARSAALNARDVQTQITLLEAQANNEERVQKMSGGAIPPDAQNRIDQNRADAQREESRLAQLAAEQARWNSGVQPARGGVILQSGRGLYRADRVASLGYRLSSPLPGPSSVENWVVFGPIVTLRIIGAAPANRLPGVGSILAVTFPTGNVLQAQITGTDPRPGSTSRNAEGFSMIARVNLNDLGEYFPGAPAIQPPSVSLAKIYLPSITAKDVPIPITENGLRPQTPPQGIFAWINQKFKSALRTAVVVGGLIGSAFAQEIPQPQAPSPQEIHQITLTNQQLTTQGSPNEWKTRDYPVERYQRLAPTDLKEFLIQNNLEISDTFFGHRRALADYVQRLAPQVTFEFVGDQYRAAGVNIGQGGPRLNSAILMYPKTNDLAPRRRIITPGNNTPLGKLGNWLGATIVSENAIAKTEKDDQLALATVQIKLLNMGAAMNNNARTLYDLYFRLLLEDTEIKNLMIELDFYRALEGSLRELSRRGLTTPADVVDFEKILINKAATDTALGVARSARKNTESQLIQLMGSAEVKLAYARAAQAASQNKETADTFTFLRPGLWPYEVSHEVVNAFGGSHFPTDLDDQLHKALAADLHFRNQDTPERLATINKLCFFDPALTRFIMSDLGATPSSLSFISIPTALERAQYGGPTAMTLLASLPAGLRPGIIPASDIAEAEAYWVSLLAQRNLLEKNKEYVIGGAFNPSFDLAARGPLPFVAALLKFGITIPDPQAVDAAQIGFRIDLMNRQNQINTLQQNQLTNFSREMLIPGEKRRDAEKALDRVAELGLKAIGFWATDPRFREGSRAQGSLDYLSAMKEQFRIERNAIEAARQNTLLSLETEPGQAALQEELTSHYGEVLEKIQSYPLPPEPEPKPQSEPWWKFPVLEPIKKVLLRPGLMRGYFSPEEINSYIIGRKTNQNGSSSKQLMREDWGVRDGVPEDELVRRKIRNVIDSIDDEQRLYNMAFLLNLNPSLRRSEHVLDRSASIQSLRNQIYKRFSEMLAETTFHFNSPQGTGYNLPLFRKNPGTFGPEFVAMHFGLYMERRNIYVLSYPLWEELMKEGNESALFGALLYELSKVEWRYMTENGKEYQIHTGDSGLLGNDDPLRDLWADEIDYQKRALRLLYLADPEDRLGWFSIEEQYRPRSPLEAIEETAPRGPRDSEPIFVRLVNEDLNRLNPDGLTRGHDPYATRPIPRTSRDKDPDTLQRFLDILFSVIPAWALTYYEEGEEKKGDSTRYLTWRQKIWMAIWPWSSPSPALSPVKAAYKAHQFDGPQFGLSPISSATMYRLYQIHRGGQRLFFAEMKRIHYVFGIGAFLIFIYFLNYYDEGIRQAFDDFYANSEILSRIRGKISLERYQSFLSAIEAFALFSLSFAKWIIEGIPVLLSLLFVLIIAFFAIWDKAEFKGHTGDVSPDDVWPTFGNSREGSSSQTLHRANPSDQRAIAYNKGLLHTGSLLVLVNFSGVSSAAWRLLMTIIHRSPDLPLPPGATIPGAERVTIPSDAEELKILQQEIPHAARNEHMSAIERGRFNETKLRAFINPVFVMFAAMRYGLPIFSRPSRETAAEGKWADVFEAVMHRLLWHLRLLFPLWHEHYQRYDMLLGVFRLHHRLRLALENGLVDQDLVDVLRSVYQPLQNDEAETWDALVKSHEEALIKGRPATRAHQNLDADDLDVIFRWSTRLFALRTPDQAAKIAQRAVAGPLYPNLYLEDQILKGSDNKARISLAQALEAQIDASWILEELVAGQGENRLFDDLPFYIDVALLLPSDAVRDISLIDEITDGRVVLFTSNPLLQPFVEDLRKNKMPKESHAEFLSLEEVQNELTSASSALVFLPPEELSWKLVETGRATFVRPPNWLFFKSSILYTYREFDYGRGVATSPTLWREIQRHTASLLKKIIHLGVLVERHTRPKQGDITSPARHNALFILLKGEDQKRREDIPLEVEDALELSGRNARGAA